MMRCAAAALAVALIAAVAAATAAGSPAAGTCARRGAPPFLDAVGSRCPFVRIDPSPPLEVRGETVDTELNLRRRGASYSILFYAAWCPFSSKLRPIFGTLSTMYPQIHHFTVEESSATPRFVNVESVSVILFVQWIPTAHCIVPCCSLFSRYGVRGFPAILLVNETTMVRYRGSKDLNSLVDFYKETTGTILVHLVHAYIALLNDHKSRSNCIY
ncbi:adenosine 5'-phosphosulfate reductase-like8 [Zea mays]|uniref:Adenosine 5'-phosphosulfate reductase-like8 n=1 Tax=Zea mays TaxID=4577 RepID=A0A1D6L8D8_MAIZE|nr:adenosine 5'-phosphosulfate reductase-like8 [Zea mays]